MAECVLTHVYAPPHRFAIVDLRPMQKPDDELSFSLTEKVNVDALEKNASEPGIYARPDQVRAYVNTARLIGQAHDGFVRLLRQYRKKKKASVARTRHGCLFSSWSTRLALMLCRLRQARLNLEFSRLTSTMPSPCTWRTMSLFFWAAWIACKSNILFSTISH